jgi:glutamine amidotransferase
MIAIIDYGMGNLRSVQKAIAAAYPSKKKPEVRIVTSPEDIAAADKLVLPGVGAMRPAMERLRELGLVDPVRTFISSGRYFLGICLGYQLLFEASTEGGEVKGLGILAGKVKRFPSSVKVPQMGWNQIHLVQHDCPMYRDLSRAAFVYFCHSYYVEPQDMMVTATLTEYGLKYASSVVAGNIWGVQFHPEKSQAAGLQILRNFVTC